MKQANEEREAFVAANLGLVQSLAHRMTGRGIEYEELYTAGCLGLVKAAEGFDESRGLRFSTYAVPVILGEIKRLFRDGGTVKVSRSLKEFSLKVTRERDRLGVALGREPTLSELADALHESVERVAEAVNVSLPALSLTQTDEEGSGQIDIEVEAPEERLSSRLALRELLSRLEERDRELIRLRYFKGMTQSQTAARLGMTQVQVSRREKKILTQLREDLLSG